MLLAAGCGASAPSSPRTPDTASAATTSAVGSSAAGEQVASAAPTPAGDTSAASFQPRPPPDGNDSPRTCKLAYSRYPGRPEVFAWNETPPAMPAGVRAMVHGWGSGLAHRSMEAWLFADGRLFFAPPGKSLRIEDTRYAYPSCKLDAAALARFDEALLAPRSLLPYRDAPIEPEDRIDLPDVFALPAVFGRPATEQTPLCFDDFSLTERTIPHASKFMSGLRVSVSLGERRVSVPEYGTLAQELLAPLESACPTLGTRLAFALGAGRD